MNYVELTITLPEVATSAASGLCDDPAAAPCEGLPAEALAEILTAELADLPFESFVEEATALKAYLPSEALDEVRPTVEATLQQYGVEGHFRPVVTEDWNAAWEADFTATDVEGRLRIRAPHHEAAPAGEMEVLIAPRMAFGSGQHATTWLMSRAVLDLGVAGRRGLDVGSGTGVLSIVALKCGAVAMDAVDIDDWADENCRTNARLNGVEAQIRPLLGDIHRVEGEHYDFILANINRNIHLQQMGDYAALLTTGGDLLLSGFLAEDVTPLTVAAVVAGFERVGCAERDGWQMLHLRRL